MLDQGVPHANAILTAMVELLFSSSNGEIRSYSILIG
jgi:hypothetical protein